MKEYSNRSNQDKENSIFRPPQIESVERNYTESSKKNTSLNDTYKRLRETQNRRPIGLWSLEESSGQVSSPKQEAIQLHSTETLKVEQKEQNQERSEINLLNASGNSQQIQAKSQKQLSAKNTIELAQTGVTNDHSSTGLLGKIFASAAAGEIRQALELPPYLANTAAQIIMQELNLPPDALHDVVKAYNKEYNNKSGKGLIVDLKNKLDGTDLGVIKLDGIDLGGKKYWEFVVAQLKRAGINIPSSVSKDKNLQQLKYLRHDDNRKGRPFKIVAKPETPIAVPETEVTYTVQDLGSQVYKEKPNRQYQWYTLYDPVTVKYNSGIPAREDHYSSGSVWENKKWQVPGDHKIICRVQFNDEPPVYVEYLQKVLPSAVVVDYALDKAQPSIDPQRQFEILKNYQKALTDAEQQPGSNRLDPKVKQQFQDDINAFDQRLKSTQGMIRYPIKAVYLSLRDAQVIPLNIFIAQTDNRIGNSLFGRYTRTIVDITNPKDERTSGEYNGIGYTPLEAIENAIKKWDSDNRYYRGIIKLEIPQQIAGELIQRQFQTDGSSFWDSVAQFLDVISFVTGITSMVTRANPAVSVPLTAISLITSSAAASIRIQQRRSEGRTDPTADKLDSLTIAGNILAGSWMIGASVRNFRTGNSYLASGILIGQLATDSGTAIILNTTYIKRYEEIMTIKDPQERTNNLIKLLQEATLANGLLAISIIDTSRELINRMGRSTETIDFDASNQNQEPSSTNSTRPQETAGRVNFDSQFSNENFPTPELPLATNDPVVQQQFGRFAYRMVDAANDFKQQFTARIQQARSGAEIRQILEEAYQWWIERRAQIEIDMGRNPTKIRNNIQPGEPNRDPFGVMSGLLDENGQPTPAYRTRAEIGQLIAQRFRVLDDNTEVLDNYVRLPDWVAAQLGLDNPNVSANRLYRGNEAERLYQQHRETHPNNPYRYGSNDAEKYITETANPSNQRILHDAGILMMSRLLEQQGSLRDPRVLEQFCDAVYFFFMGPIKNRGSDSIIRGYVTSLSPQMTGGRAITLPHDVDVQAYARTQQDFRQWLSEQLRRQLN